MEFAGMFMIHLHTKFHMPILNYSLVIAIKPESYIYQGNSNENNCLTIISFQATYCLFFFCSELIQHRSMCYGKHKYQHKRTKHLSSKMVMCGNMY
jgi:hypothetical protein